MNVFRKVDQIEKLIPLFRVGMPRIYRGVSIGRIWMGMGNQIPLVSSVCMRKNDAIDQYGAHYKQLDDY